MLAAAAQVTERVVWWMAGMVSGAQWEMASLDGGMQAPFWLAPDLSEMEDYFTPFTRKIIEGLLSAD